MSGIWTSFVSEEVQIQKKSEMRKLISLFAFSVLV